MSDENKNKDNTIFNGYSSLIESSRKNLIDAINKAKVIDMEEDKEKNPSYLYKGRGTHGTFK